MSTHSVLHSQLPLVLGTPEDLRETIRRKSKLKGRQPDEQATADVRGCVMAADDAELRRDLLVEYLHRINDRFGGLWRGHLVALSREMRIPMAEVYEVASFY